MTSGLDTFNENRRLQQIYETVLHFAADVAVDRTLLGRPRRRLQRWIYRLDATPPALSTPVRTRLMLEGLGPTYVKLGQIMSSQASTLPDEWRRELDRLQNEVPPVSYDVARATVMEELGAPPEELFAWFSPEPLAAASLAQVHRATLIDGREVVVKVQRPALDRQVKADLGVARVFTTYAERRSAYAREIGLRSMVEEFGTTLLDELDYLGEAYNMERLAQNLTGVPGVHVPRLERSLSSRRVLTQEFIRGVKISDVAAMRTAGLDVEAIGESALRATVKMLLIDGFFHADPHPGNLLVDLDTGVVTFLDSGMVGQLSWMQRAHLVFLLWTIVQGDVPAMGRELRSLSIVFAGEPDERRFERSFERRMGRYVGGASRNLTAVFAAALSVLRDNGYRLDPELTLALKSLTQASASFTALVPADRAFTTAALDAVFELGQEALSGDAAVDSARREGIRLLGEGLKVAPEYLRGLLSWQDQLKRGKLTVHLDTTSLDRQVDEVRSITSMVVVAVLVAGALVGSAISSSVFEGAVDERLALASQLGFFASLCVAAVLIIVLLRRMLRSAARR